ASVTNPAQPKAEPKVKFLSDNPDSGYAWLERKQCQAYQGSGLWPITTADALISLLSRLPQRLNRPAPEETVKGLRIDETILPTRCEDLPSYWLMTSVAADIAAATKNEQAALQLIWGTLPVPGVYAEAQQYNNDQIVVMNQDVFPFLYKSTLIVDRTIDIRETEEGLEFDFSEAEFKRRIKQYPELVDDFARLMIALARQEDLPDMAPASDAERPLILRQVTAMQRFIIAHEFGHVISGHTGYGYRLLVLPQPGATFLVTAQGWDNELKADEVGLRLADIVYDKQKFSKTDDQLAFRVLASYSPALFLEIADALDDLILCGGSNEGSGRSLLESDQVKIVFDIASKRARKMSFSPSREEAVILGRRFNDHPPGWLRSRLIIDQGDTLWLDQNHAEQEVQFAKALIRNARSLSTLAESRMRAAFQEKTE
ncbi:MAG TPA: hypothetical protein VH394_12425, partial [Thermoanaerobaculia bacterium]|nr:hypothetical protein [Thermoanaerobaculia bacterium]